MLLKDVAPLASVGHIPRSQVLSSVTRAWEEGLVSHALRARLEPCIPVS
jgi:hypothetical protein